jgi:hypothetical protein
MNLFSHAFVLSGDAGNLPAALPQGKFRLPGRESSMAGRKVEKGGNVRIFRVSKNSAPPPRGFAWTFRAKCAIQAP